MNILLSTYMERSFAAKMANMLMCALWGAFSSSLSMPVVSS